MAYSSRYALPFLQAGQAQKEVTHNDALAQIDTLLHLAVESRRASVANEVNGTSWIVGSNATGVWAGHDGKIAAFDNSGWAFVTPLDGCIAFVRDESAFVHYAAGQWRDAWPVPSLAVGASSASGGSVIMDVSGGAVIDAQARTALSALLAALRLTGLVVAG